jgi:hypothetical protein
MGERLPSVTGILDAVGLGPDLSRVPAAALEAARVRGTAVHRAIEDHAYGLLEAVDPAIAPWLAAYERFLKETGATAIVSEVEVVHAAFRYIGHIDRIAWLDSTRYLIDWKTGDSLALGPVSYQLAGYRLGWNACYPAEPITATAAVQLRKNGTYRFHVIETGPVEHIFLAAATIVHARRSNGDPHAGEPADPHYRDRYAD